MIGSPQNRIEGKPPFENVNQGLWYEILTALGGSKGVYVEVPMVIPEHTKHYPPYSNDEDALIYEILILFN